MSNATKPGPLWIIDDEEELASLLKVGITMKLDVDIVCHKSADEATGALQAAKITPPSVVLLDFNMPGTNGLDWVDAYPPQLTPPLVVLMSGVLTREVALRAANGRLHGVLEKPMSIDLVVGAVRSALAYKASLQANKELLFRYDELASQLAEAQEHFAERLRFLEERWMQETGKPWPSNDKKRFLADAIKERSRLIFISETRSKIEEIELVIGSLTDTKAS